MEGGDWRGQLQQDSRQRIVNKIMETLKRHLPYSGPEGLQELKKIAVRFEEKIYIAATSQSDYLRKISMKMLTMETKSQNPDSMQPGGGSNSQDPGSQSMQPQLQNQVQQLQLPMVSSQSQVRQQILSQNLHNNIALNGAPNSSGLSSGLPAMTGTMPNIPGPNANIQNMQSLPNMASNAIGNSMGQGMPAGNYANPQRQVQNRQQPVANQEQAQHSQGSHQYVYNQQVFMKPKYQTGGIPQQPIMQSQVSQQQQQQNLMLPNHLQSSQQPVIQPSLRQTSSPASSSSSTLQSQQSSLQHSNQSMLQQPSQSVLRQQQQQQPQAPAMHQQQNPMSQHSILSSQQPHHTAQQPNAANIQPSQLIGQQNIVVDTQQQQRMMPQQNAMPNMQQQHTASKQNNIPSLLQSQSAAQQNNIPNVHQQQLGSQNNLSGFQQQQAQQMQASMSNMLPNQSQSQPMQHQLISQMQSQSGQMQQQLGLQQQANTLSRDMQQRIQASVPLNQQPTTVDQKPIMQPQRVIGESQLTSRDPSSQMGNSGGDWQEEVYQKIKSMNEMYYSELNEAYQRIVAKLQQHDSIPQMPKGDQFDKLTFFKGMLERLLSFLRISKNEIQPALKDKMVQVEKQIISILNSNRPRKPVSSLQKGQHMLAAQQPQQQQPQISQMQTNEGQMNSQIQSLNGQGSAVTNLSNLQHGSLSSASGVPNSRQSIMDIMQHGSNFDAGQGNALNQMQQVAINSLQQNSVSGPQQMNIPSVTSQSGLTTLASSVNPLHGNSNMIQGQQIKQEPLMLNQQLKQQYQQRQIQQQYIQRQQIMQQQQQLQAHQQAVQMPGQQVTHLNQINDANDVKLRHQMAGKTGVLQSHSSIQRPAYHHQSFSTSSQQAPSSQIPHHSSPQMEQQSLLASHTKVGTPSQSANSPFVVPSPSTSVAPSPMLGDYEKIVSVVPSQSNAGNSNNLPTPAASVQNQSLAIGTPGISASPLLAEFSNPDGPHGVLPNIIPATSNVVERPLDRLINAVKSLTPTALSASVNDVSSVVRLTDRIAGSAPGNGSRAAMGEDLVAITKCRLQARNFFSADGSGCTKKVRRCISAMTSNVVSCTGTMNESSKSAGGNESYGQSTEVSSKKRPRNDVNHVLEEELHEINVELIDTVVHISDDVDPTAVAAAAECAEGTVVKCCFSAVGLGPNLKSQFASAQMSPIQPLRLLIPKDYPSCSPVLLDKFPIEVSKEYEDLSMKAKSRLSISLRALPQPMSLGEIARTWDKCARAVISEYAQQSGGGTFSSKYGTWEKCLSAA